jgi:hypothetical protein
MTLLWYIRVLEKAGTSATSCIPFGQIYSNFTLKFCLRIKSDKIRAKLFAQGSSSQKKAGTSAFGHNFLMKAKSNPGFIFPEKSR